MPSGKAVMSLVPVSHPPVPLPLVSADGLGSEKTMFSIITADTALITFWYSGFSLTA
jgi:hypothetical protein